MESFRVIYISHIEDYIPRNIHDFNPLFIEKPSKKEMVIFDELIDGIPATKLPFQTFSPSTWDYDIDIDNLFYKLSIVPQNQIKDAISLFLNGEEYDPLQGEKKEILMWMLDHGYPNRKPKEIFSSYYTWKIEWERNQE